MAHAAPLDPSPSNQGTSRDPLRPGDSKEIERTPDEFGQFFRELVTTTVAAVIVGLSAWMLIGAFKAAGATDTAQGLDAFNRQKDIMMYGLSLLGTVMGYYFGRAPAELRAKQAEQAANTNQKNLSETSEKLTTAATAALESKRETERVKSDVRETLAEVVAPQGRAVLGGDGGELSPEAAMLQDRVRRLLDRLG